MLQQEALIERVRGLCEEDGRVVAALMYGSFALGQGDRFSDIEFYVFFEDGAVGGLDEEAWVGRIAPLGVYYVNEFGSGTAVFEDLVRGEFHFEAASDVGLVDAWETAWFPVSRLRGAGRQGRRTVPQGGPLGPTPARPRHPGAGAVPVPRPDQLDTYGHQPLEEGRTRPRRGVLGPDPRPPAPGRGLVEGEERQLAQPHAQARGGGLGGRLRTVQDVHRGA